MASKRKLKLSTEDSEKIENMFVKVGKIGGFSRSREKAGAWNYFGELRKTRKTALVNRLPASQMTAS